MKIGARIKDLRTLCGLTQEELAARCELTKGYISQIENDLTSPSISTLTDLLDALGTDKDFFFGLRSGRKDCFRRGRLFRQRGRNGKNNLACTEQPKKHHGTDQFYFESRSGNDDRPAARRPGVRVCVGRDNPNQLRQQALCLPERGDVLFYDRQTP